MPVVRFMSNMIGYWEYSVFVSGILHSLDIFNKNNWGLIYETVRVWLGPSTLLEVIEGDLYTQKLSQEKKNLYLMLLYEHSTISQIIQAVSRRFLTAA
jgi:hypothetical protein